MRSGSVVTVSGSGDVFVGLTGSIVMRTGLFGSTKTEIPET